MLTPGSLRPNFDVLRPPQQILRRGLIVATGALALVTGAIAVDEYSVLHRENTQETQIGDLLTETDNLEGTAVSLKVHCRDNSTILPAIKSVLAGEYNSTHVENGWNISGSQTINLKTRICNDITQGLKRGLGMTSQNNTELLSVTDETLDDNSGIYVIGGNDRYTMTNDAQRFLYGLHVSLHEVGHSARDIGDEACADSFADAILADVVAERTGADPATVQSMINLYSADLDSADAASYNNHLCPAD